MNSTIQNIKNFRLYLLRQIEGLSTQQLNNIPVGYNNNIIWNITHLISVQQNLCYVRAGLPIVVDDKYFTPYMPGTKPERFIEEHEITSIKEILISSVDRLQLDFETILLKKYSPSIMTPKVYGVEVSNIEQAITYLLYHEGVHTGCIVSLKHLV